MADTYKRSAINIASPRQQRVRSSGPVRHQVPEFVGASEGLNPMAGDMSGAFSRFFGQLQSQIGQVADARAMADKERERDINAEAKRQAVADAQRSFMNEKIRAKALPIFSQRCHRVLSYLAILSIHLNVLATVIPTPPHLVR